MNRLSMITPPSNHRIVEGPYPADLLAQPGVVVFGVVCTALALAVAARRKQGGGDEAGTLGPWAAADVAP